MLLVQKCLQLSLEFDYYILSYKSVVASIAIWRSVLRILISIQINHAQKLIDTYQNKCEPPEWNVSDTQLCLVLEKESIWYSGWQLCLTILQNSTETLSETVTVTFTLTYCKGNTTWRESCDCIVVVCPPRSQHQHWPAIVIFICISTNMNMTCCRLINPVQDQLIQHLGTFVIENNFRCQQIVRQMSTYN